MDKTSYSAGESGKVDIKNKGGIDTTYNYNVKLIGPLGDIIYQNSGNAIIQSGSQSVINFNINSQAVDGSYYFNVICTDLKTNRVTVLERQIEISGLKANLVITTDKKVYFTGETITATALINNLDGAINNGILNLKVFQTTQGISEIVHNQRGLPDRVEISNQYIDVVVDSIGTDSITLLSMNKPEKLSKCRSLTTSSDKGRFTIGTTFGDPDNPNDDDKKLLFGHPGPGTSFSTVRIDGNDYIYGSDAGAFINLPHFEGDNIVSIWRINDVNIY